MIRLGYNAVSSCSRSVQSGRMGRARGLRDDTYHPSFGRLQNLVSVTAKAETHRPPPSGRLKRPYI